MKDKEDKGVKEVKKEEAMEGEEQEEEKEEVLMDVETAKHILSHVGDKFCQLVKTENTAVTWIRKDSKSGVCSSARSEKTAQALSLPPGLKETRQVTLSQSNGGGGVVVSSCLAMPE